VRTRPATPPRAAASRMHRGWLRDSITTAAAAGSGKLDASSLSGGECHLSGICASRSAEAHGLQMPRLSSGRIGYQPLIASSSHGPNPAGRKLSQSPFASRPTRRHAAHATRYRESSGNLSSSGWRSILPRGTTRRVVVQWTSVRECHPNFARWRGQGSLREFPAAICAVAPATPIPGEPLLRGLQRERLRR
jgi:hypothetical protein